jgi:hypothetical protein
MDALRTWLGIASIALLTVAVGVAWWEHLHRTRARHREREQAAQAARARSGVVSNLDAELHAVGAALDAQEHARTSARELQARRDALEATLQRLAPPDPGAHHAAWPETEPMVLSTGIPPRAERAESVAR